MKVKIDYKRYKTDSLQHMEFKVKGIHVVDDIIERKDFKKKSRDIVFTLTKECEHLSPLTKGNTIGFPLDWIEKLVIGKLEYGKV